MLEEVYPPRRGILARLVARLAAGVALLRRGPAGRDDDDRPVCIVVRGRTRTPWPGPEYGTPAGELAERVERRRRRRQSYMR